MLACSIRERMDGGGQSKNQIEINDKNTEISVLGTRPRNLPMDQDFHDQEICFLFSFLLVTIFFKDESASSHFKKLWCLFTYMNHQKKIFFNTIIITWLIYFLPVFINCMLNKFYSHARKTCKIHESLFVANIFRCELSLIFAIWVLYQNECTESVAMKKVVMNKFTSS